MIDGTLRIENLVWTFPQSEKPFLEIPELRIASGNAVALVGPSGSGKSTLLFLLAGLEDATSGSISWGSFRFPSMNAKEKELWRRRYLGLVFQDFQLIPELTAIQNVLLPQTFSHWSIPVAKKTRAYELLEQLGIGKPEAKAHTLSRGEMQRVAIARALLEKPMVVLADEPTASLDAENEAGVAQLLLELVHRDGCTLIVSTHHRLLRDQADRVIVLSHGHIDIDDNPEESTRNFSAASPTFFEKSPVGEAQL